MDVSGYLLASGKPFYALALLGLITPQVVFQVTNVTFLLLIIILIIHFKYCQCNAVQIMEFLKDWKILLMILPILSNKLMG